MNKLIFSFILLATIAGTSNAQQLGEGRMPVPVFTNVSVVCGVTFDPVSGFYTYSYTVANPSANTGEIDYIGIDITRPKDSLALPTSGLNIPYGRITKTFDQEAQDLDKSVIVVPVGITVPAGTAWRGFVGSVAGVFPHPYILPGQTQSGMAIYSPGLPSIRVVELRPFWLYEGIVTDETSAASTQTEESLILRVKTLGPWAPPMGNGGPSLTGMVAQISAWVDEAAALGWLKDPALRDALKTKIDFAKNTYSATMTDADAAACRAALADFMALVTQSTPAQRTDEAYALFYHNIKYVLDNFPPAYVPIESRLTVSPDKTSATMGTWVNLSALYTENMRPAQNDGYYGPRLIRLRVISGPNMDVLLPNVEGYLCNASDVQYGFWPTPGRLLDAAGQAAFTYRGMQEGTDVIVAENMIEGMAAQESPPVEVTWRGGPDLVVGFFFPPVIELQPGETSIDVLDATLNQGNGPADSSVTRYYLSTDPLIDTAVDPYLGERPVPPLTAGAKDRGSMITVRLPPGLQPDTLYYVGACVDADQTVPELDENNNCGVNGATQITMPLKKLSNQPPICTSATARLKNPAAPEEVREHPAPADVAVDNVTDPDQDALTIIVTAVTRLKMPEAATPHNERAEKEHGGKAEIKQWTVTFTAGDGKGGTCGGETILTLTEAESDKHHSTKEKEPKKKSHQKKK